MLEIEKNWGVTIFVSEKRYLKATLILKNRCSLLSMALMSVSLKILQINL